LVAAAFNNTRVAESELRTLVPSASHQQLADAYYALYRLYIRLGRYAKAVADERLMAAADSQQTLSKEEAAEAETMERLPDFRIVSRSPSKLRTTFALDSRIIEAPVTINGKQEYFEIDTAAGMSLATESEAAQLGIQMIGGTVWATGTGGGPAKGARYGVAEQLKIGNTEMRDVAFLVIPDSILDVYPPGHRGGDRFARAPGSPNSSLETEWGIECRLSGEASRPAPRQSTVRRGLSADDG
jgi:predicted aspartyl protease